MQHVTGADLTPAMLDQARALQAEAGVANVEWRQADVAALPFADRAFSLVTCRAMLHHTASPAVVLGEMSRVCAPGGRIAASDLTPAAAKAAAFDAIEILRDPSHGHAMRLRNFAPSAPPWDCGRSPSIPGLRPAPGSGAGHLVPTGGQARPGARTLSPGR